MTLGLEARSTSPSPSLNQMFGLLKNGVGTTCKVCIGLLGP